ncbi:MAG: hypothetical protein IPM57_03870 [Oligoflexia bacterium]|nr:hypothetical protein [Oligoflexia bacterium]
MALQQDTAVEIFDAAMGYLQNTDKNTVVNNHKLMIEGKVVSEIRGLIGIRHHRSTELEGALCWGEGAGLISLVFSIRRLTSTVEVTLLEAPTGISGTTLGLIVRDYISSLNPKLYKTMVNRKLKKKTGGINTGRRLEAWKRDGTLPKNKFAEAKSKFTPTFVELAFKLNVTYK